jgi:hypothetical protein
VVAERGVPPSDGGHHHSQGIAAWVERRSRMVGVGSNNAADLLVIFGITGDLARKMTLRSLYRHQEKPLP